MRNTALDLTYLFIKGNNNIHYQRPIAELVETSILNREGTLSSSGALAADTGKFTGRSPYDRFVVKDDLTADNVWWGAINQPVTEEAFEALFEQVGNYFSSTDKHLFVRDVEARSGSQDSITIRVVTETAYQSIFVNNMFVRPTVTDPGVKPEWSILAAPGFTTDDPGKYGVHNPNFVIINFSRKTIVIAGTGYTGEIKKGIFSVLNFVLPLQKKILSMHCSANTDAGGDTALFFGLSGTGKTTLSADKGRYLIGDDEHGWDDKGVFNFEGGCYAKCIGLTEENEPEIYNAIRFGSLLENINYKPGTRVPDYDDTSKTENTRVAYPINFIEGSVASGTGSTPKNIFFLTADAFGVIPPVSKLTTTQAMYHFISGYTAKVAGTEVGVKEPKAVFSACFGEAFLPLHPSYYAELLRHKIEAGNINVWLINTGWIAGPYGIGRRIKLSYTRAIINAALNGTLKETCYEKHPVFGLEYPASCPGVPDAVLNPVQTWGNESAYYAKANQLASLFIDNFKKFEEGVSEDVLNESPNVLQRSF